MMKGISLAVLALAGVLILVSSEAAVAGWGKGSGKSEGTRSESMERSPEETTQPVGSYEGQEALETGRFPEGPESWTGNPGSGAESRTFELGGSRYRIGVDTP